MRQLGIANKYRVDLTNERQRHGCQTSVKCLGSLMSCSEMTLLRHLPGESIIYHEFVSRLQPPGRDLYSQVPESEPRERVEHRPLELFQTLVGRSSCINDHRIRTLIHMSFDSWTLHTLDIPGNWLRNHRTHYKWYNWDQLRSASLEILQSQSFVSATLYIIFLHHGSWLIWAVTISAITILILMMWWPYCGK